MHLLRDKGDGFSWSPCAGGPSDAVNVVFGVGGDVKVYHHVNVGYVQTTARYVSSNKDGIALTFELVESAEPFWLAELAVDGDGTKS